MLVDIGLCNIPVESFCLEGNCLLDNDGETNIGKPMLCFYFIIFFGLGKRGGRDGSSGCKSNTRIEC
jgi:hypothetical protein